jgi:hypothetical protein
MSLFQTTGTELISNCSSSLQANRNRSKWIGLIIVGCVFAVAASVAWRKWANPLGDFGTQLYVPWKLSQGAVLFRDVFYISGGPLSQYFNALLFKIFGVGLLPILISNLTVAALIVLATYWNFFKVSDALTAATMCIGIIVICAFAQFDWYGDMNFAIPYSHEATHGLLLSILAVGSLAGWLNGRKIKFLVAAGFLSGLVFLTKPEIFMALAACAASAFFIFVAREKKIRTLFKPLAVFSAAATLPVLGFFFYFWHETNWQDGWRYVAFAWLPLFNSTIVNDALYKWCTGMDEPRVHLSEMFLQFSTIAIVTVLLAGYLASWNRITQKLNWMRPRWLVLLVLLLPLLAMAVYATAFNWRISGAPLPLLTLLTGTWLAWKCRANWNDEKIIFPLLWSVFGLVLLSKMGVFSRLWHYGFYLALPAIGTTVYFFLWLFPRWLKDKYHFPAPWYRIFACLILMVAFTDLFCRSTFIYGTESLAMTGGKDKIFVPDKSMEAGKNFKAALAWIQTNVPPDATLAGLPIGGGALNFFSRHTNSTPCVFWDPHIMGEFGEETMTADFEKNPPDYVFVVEWKEFRTGYIGEAYGQDVMRWIKENYQPVKFFGSDPVKLDAYGVQAFQRTSVNKN